MNGLAWRHPSVCGARRARSPARLSPSCPPCYQCHVSDYQCSFCGAVNAAYGSHCHECGDDWANAREISLPAQERSVQERTVGDRCPSCGSTSLYASDIYSCLDCGESFHPRDVVRQGRDLPCPSCQAPLAPAKAANTSSWLTGCYGCSRCGGVWFDNNACSIIVHHLDPSLVEVASVYERTAAAAQGRSSTESTTPSRVCPIGLERLATASVKDVDIDTCQKHGTWFDVSELRKVAEYFEADRTAKSHSLPADVRRVLETVAGAYRSSGRRD